MDIQSLSTKELKKKVRSNLRHIGSHARSIPFMTGVFAQGWVTLAEETKEMEEELARRQNRRTND